MKNKKFWVSLMAGLMALIMLLSMVLGLLPHAHAASSSEIRDQIEQLEADEKALQEKIDALKQDQKENLNDVRQIMEQKANIDQQIGFLRQKIRNLDNQISAYALLIADKQEDLDEKQAYLQELNEKNKERIRAMEEQGKLSYWSVLFKAGSFSDLLDRMNMVEEIAASDKRRLKELGEAAENVAAAQLELEQEKADLQETKKELDTTHAELDEKRKEADELLLELIAKGVELEELAQMYEEQEKAFLAEIAQQEREYTQAKQREYLEWLATSETTQPPTTATTPGGSTNNSSATNSSGQTTVNTGSGWRVPVSYKRLESPFGNRVSPTTGASSYHQGVDLSADSGTPIYASRGGQVSAATYGSAAGYYVRINHMDGFSSIYMHMTHYVVSAGQNVSQGQLIGYVGQTGVATGNHLHFGIMYNGAYINPSQFLDFGPLWTG